MSAASGSALSDGLTDTVGKGKGKGKTVDQNAPHDISMDEDSSDEESVNEEAPAEVEEEEDDDDNMEEIDTSNIITDGRRTRGKTIDFAEAAKKAEDEGINLDDDDDDDDEDFEAKDDDADNMHE